MRTRLAAVALAGCATSPAQFTCTENAECASASSMTGTCQADQLCSMADSTCPSGQRYTDYSGKRSNTCTTPKVLEIAAGGSETCALIDGGAVWCWGGGSGPAAISPPSLSGPKIEHIAVGAAGLCALTIDGAVHCAQPTTASLVPVIGLTASEISVGDAHVCAVTKGPTAGNVECWGSNASRQLGDPSVPSTVTSTMLVQAVGVSGATHVAAGFDASYAVVDTKVWSWGSNGLDQLGRSATINHPETPAMLDDVLSPTRTLVTAGHQFGCALASSSTSTVTVQCWGRNDRHQAPGSTGDPVSKATSISLPTDAGTFVDVRAGGGHGCARTDHGTTLCWGQNDSCESSPAGCPGDAAPSPVTDERGVAIEFTQIAVGDVHSCGLTTTQCVACWGKRSDAVGTADPGPVQYPATPAELGCR